MQTQVQRASHDIRRVLPSGLPDGKVWTLGVMAETAMAADH